MTDTSTQEGRDKRTEEVVDGYVARRNFAGIARLIGGSPRHDMQDYSDADAGEPPVGAHW
jgi:hypothetical protein